jgi:hypothetical protein
MEKPTLTARVEILEEIVRTLETLPKRVEAVESQILHLREEMRRGFSAVRSEFSAVRGKCAAIHEGTGGEFTAIRQEIRDGDEETRRYMRVLHAEVLARIATIAEGRNTT